MKLSIVVPCFNEEDTIRSFVQEADNALNGRESVEYIFIDDGSGDDTLGVLKELADDDARIRYVSFSRNFGKEAAIFAGLEHSSGDYVAVMDADLQDPPAMLPILLDAVAGNGADSFDIARMRRKNRKGEPPVRSLCARIFYRIINVLSGIELVDGARDYQVMKRCVVDAILQMREYNRFFKGISSWVGFRTRWFEYENIQRAGGRTSWSFTDLVRYAVEGIVAFSTKPLQIASWIGTVCFIIALSMILFIVVRTLAFGDPVSGWPSTICAILLIGGLQLLCIGILGQYLSRAYLETKHRPIYLARESNISRTSL